MTDLDPAIADALIWGGLLLHAAWMMMEGRRK